MQPNGETPAQQSMRKALGSACLLASRDRFAEALTVLEDAIRDYRDGPDNWICQAYRELSEAAAMVGDTEKGLAAAQKSLDIDAQIGASENPILVQREAAHIHRRLALNHFLRREPAETYVALDKCRSAGFFYGPRANFVPREQSTIYTRDVIDAIVNCGVRVEEILAAVEKVPGTTLRRYPDGAVQIAGDGQEVFHNRAFAFVQFMETELRGGGELDLKARRRLFNFLLHPGTNNKPHSFCTVNAWGDWVPKYGSEDSFHVRGWPFADSAHIDRQRVPVTIVFKRRLPQEARTMFIKTLIGWAGSVRHEGVFGEGRIEFVEPSVTFYTKAAQFTINIAASGPCTLVWLILSLLAFSPVAIMTDVCFGNDWLAYFGLSGEQDGSLSLCDNQGV